MNEKNDCDSADGHHY